MADSDYDRNAASRYDVGRIMTGGAAEPSTEVRIPDRNSQAEGVHVALLRGINVGGKHSLPMKELTPMFVAAGCKDVRTYIQSGNVVFRARQELGQQIPTLIAQAIGDAKGFQVPVVARTAGELERVAQNNPFLAAGADEAKVHVGFLADAPSPEAVAGLDAGRSPPDELAVEGREIYLHLPNGVARTKLTNDYFDRALGTISTSAIGGPFSSWSRWPTALDFGLYR